MTELLKDCESFARPCKDDILIYSRTCEELKDHVREVLTSTRKARNPAKCKWSGIHMDFLGHRVGNGSMMRGEKPSSTTIDQGS